MSLQDGHSNALELRPASRSRLTETVARQLLSEIQLRGLEPGTKMPSERELMQSLGVGRSTVREALHGLAMLGVVEIRHGQGAFVTGAAGLVHAPDGIAAALAKGVTSTLLEARRPLETEIARLAAIRRTPADLTALSAVLESHESALLEERSASKQSARFHLVLAEAAHNDVLAGFVASYRKLLQERGPRLEELDGYREWELAEHRRLFAAVRARDPELAAELMRAHLDQVVLYYAQFGWSLEPENPLP
jgi:GntR family transcriptional repressor for pyruvate dehydrogenase complex